MLECFLSPVAVLIVLMVGSTSAVCKQCSLWGVMGTSNTIQYAVFFFCVCFLMHSYESITSTWPIIACFPSVLMMLQVGRDFAVLSFLSRSSN